MNRFVLMLAVSFAIVGLFAPAASAAVPTEPVESPEVLVYTSNGVFFTENCEGTTLMDLVRCIEEQVGEVIAPVVIIVNAAKAFVLNAARVIVEIAVDAVERVCTDIIGRSCIKTTFPAIIDLDDRVEFTTF